MNLRAVMRITYGLGWIALAIALIYRALLFTGLFRPENVGFAPRTMLLFSGFVFVVSIATAMYLQTSQQVPAAKDKSKAATA